MDSAPTELARKIGSTIRAARERAGVTLDSLAEDSHVSKGQLSKLERGLVPNPGVVTLKVVAGAVGLSLSQAIDPGAPGQEGVGENEMLHTLLQDIRKLQGDVEDVPGLLAKWARLPKVQKRMIANLIAVSEWDLEEGAESKVVRAPVKGKPRQLPRGREGEERQHG